MAVTKEQVRAALADVATPGGGDLVSRDLVSEIVLAPGRVYFAITVPGGAPEDFEPVRRAAEQAVAALDGVEVARVSLTAERQGTSEPAPAPARRSERPAESARRTVELPDVRHIVAVASGKGGVGKSTTAVNLALALVAQGRSVAILDADIYGPSMPRLLGVTGRPAPGRGRNLKPMEAFGLKVMSMGFLVGEDVPMIWRGPMVMQALVQMLREVDWGVLDVLIVDMPPGTGDAQLTLAQQAPLSGAVIVSTPQDLALIDARKGLAMFAKVEVPVLGIVENMSTFVCPHCGGVTNIFGHGGAEAEAKRLGVPFLGAVPLDLAIREGSDEGRPIVVDGPGSPHAIAYGEIAAQVWAALEGPRAAAPAPELELSPARDVLTAIFDDGEVALLSAEYLRVESPSAEVQGHGPGERVTVAGKRRVKIDAIEPVGNYAARLRFDDGHATGLYSWDYLRELWRERERRWAEYLDQLEVKGLARDP